MRPIASLQRLQALAAPFVAWFMAVPVMLARVPEIAAWVLIAALAVATAGTMAMAGLAVDPASVWRPGVPCLALIGGAAIYRSVRPDQRIAAALMAVAQVIAFTALAALWSYAMAGRGGALWDDTLQSWDEALGLDWRAYLDVVNAHPCLALLYRLAYQSIMVQLVVAATVLALTGRLAACRVFVLATIIAGCATIAISSLMPAVSMYVHLGLVPGDYPAIDATAAYAPLVPFNGLRNGTLHVVSLASMEGIIAFPSFHAALGIVFLVAFWQVRWARWPAVVLNMVLLAATPINGGHYFVDVMAGVLVAVTAVMAASRLDRTAQGAKGSAVTLAALVRSVAPRHAPR